MKKLILAGLLIAFAAPTYGADYPTKPDEKDRLCQAMAETRAIALQPRDRVFWEDQCTCVPYPPVTKLDDSGNLSTIRIDKSICGHGFSKKFKGRVKELYESAERISKAEIQIAARGNVEWESLAPIRDPYWKCVSAIVPGVAPPPAKGRFEPGRWCAEEMDAIEEACKKTSLKEHQCKATSEPFRVAK